MIWYKCLGLWGVVLILLVGQAMAGQVGQSGRSGRSGQVGVPREDSVEYRDTLIPTFISISHKSLQAGFEVSDAWDNYSSSGLPQALSLEGCDHYSTGRGMSPAIGIVAQIPFWGDVNPWVFATELRLRLLNNSFSWDQQGFSRRVEESVLRPFTVNHELQSKMTFLDVMPSFVFQPFHTGILKSVFANLGASLSIPILTNFERDLHLVQPGDHFSNAARDSILSSGHLPNIYGLVPALEFGLGWTFPLSHVTHASPYIQLELPIIGVTKYWSELSFRAGMQIRFDLTPNSETVLAYTKSRIPVIHRTVPLAIAHSALSATIDAVAVDKAGKESKVVSMQIEEVRSRNIDPILHYIFFDENSASIPQRYLVYFSAAEADRSFRGSMDRENIGPLELYRETLNILGDRMRREPGTTITLIGCTSGSVTEPKGVQLSKSRTETVAKYLKNIWRIDSKRIKMESRELPEKPSPTGISTGREEDQRVEIRASDERLLRPVTVHNIEHLATPDEIRLRTNVSSDTGIAQMVTTITSGAHELARFTSNATNTNKLWAPTEEALMGLQDSLKLHLFVRDSTGDTTTAVGYIPLKVTRLTTEKSERIERFSLILFNFDESSIGGRNESLIAELAKLLVEIKPERVVIVGYTDETGNAQHNVELSESRAEQTKRSLENDLKKLGGVSTIPIFTEGRGSQEILFDNSLPEGRFFSRTVTVTVERTLVDGKSVK